MKQRPSNEDDAKNAQATRAKDIRAAIRGAAVSRGGAPRQPRDFIQDAMREEGVFRRTPSFQQLLAQPERDVSWLKDALAAALRLELFTIPPYLNAYWSIEDADRGGYAARSIRKIWRDEMLHLGLIANMTVAIGATPSFTTTEAVPRYPGPLPGNVAPGLVIPLGGLSRESLRRFMDVERPAHPLAAAGEPFATIGEFYEAVQLAFNDLQPPLDVTRQLTETLGLFRVTTLEDVARAIDLIRMQGEGSETSPFASGGADLAHYYRFGELFHGRRLLSDATGHWSYSGADVEFPHCHPVSTVPEGGWDDATLSDAVRTALRGFDATFSTVLRQLEGAWSGGGEAALGESVSAMFELESFATELMSTNLPNSTMTYAPEFRFV